MPQILLVFLSLSSTPILTIILIIPAVFRITSMKSTSSSLFLLKYAITNNALSKRQNTPLKIPSDPSLNSTSRTPIIGDTYSNPTNLSADHLLPSYLAVEGHFMHFGISTRGEKVWLSSTTPRDSLAPATLLRLPILKEKKYRTLDRLQDINPSRWSCARSTPAGSPLVTKPDRVGSTGR